MLRLKETRESKGISQATVARDLGLSRQGYGYYESGQRTPSTKVLKQLADYFGVTTDYLLGMPPNMATRVPPQYMSADTSAIDKYFQEIAQKDDTEFALKNTDDIKIITQLVAVLQHADEETKKAVYEYLQTSHETKKALSPIVAITQNKK